MLRSIISVYKYDNFVIHAVVAGKTDIIIIVNGKIACVIAIFHGKFTLGRLYVPFYLEFTAFRFSFDEIRIVWLLVVCDHVFENFLKTRVDNNLRLSAPIDYLAKNISN